MHRVLTIQGSIALLGQKINRSLDHSDEKWNCNEKKIISFKNRANFIKNKNINKYKTKNNIDKTVSTNEN